MKIPFAIGIIWIICIAGCAGNVEHMRTNLELTQAFEDGRPPPEYRYYVTGRENLPNAVIGIDRKYRQRPDFGGRSIRSRATWPGRCRICFPT